MPLGQLTNNKLRGFGRRLDSKFYPGVAKLFGDLRHIVAGYKNFDIQFYIISGGLEEVIRGSQIVQKEFAWAAGCRLACDTPTGRLKDVKRGITFSEKTRYLFEINKFGLDLRRTESSPYLVNKSIPHNQREIPWTNMIYVGDGLTDIPCFSLIEKQGGLALGVFNPDEKSAKRALREFLKTNRVTSMHLPHYGPKDELGLMLRAAVSSKCMDLSVRKYQAEDVE